jgi:hypothetical protein
MVAMKVRNKNMVDVLHPNLILSQLQLSAFSTVNQKETPSYIQ